MIPPVLQFCVRRYENSAFVLINMFVSLEEIILKLLIRAVRGLVYVHH